MEKAEKPPVVRGVLHRFPRAILAIADLSAYGMKKHGINLAGTDHLVAEGDAEGQRLDALGRHLCMEAIHGPKNPDDQEFLHATQAAWNALARLELLLKAQDE